MLALAHRSLPRGSRLLLWVHGHRLLIVSYHGGSELPWRCPGEPWHCSERGTLPCLVDGFVSAAPLLTLAKLSRLTQPTASQTGQEATGPREERSAVRGGGAKWVCGAEAC